MGILDRVNRAIGSKNKRNEFPTTNKEYTNGKIKDKKYLPKKKGSRTTKLLTTIGIILACFCVFKLVVFLTQDNAIFDHSKINIKVPSYTTKSLEDAEYYDYDFEDI